MNHAITGIAPSALALPPPQIVAPSPATSQGFSDMILNGLHDMEHKVNNATDLVRAFAVDDSVPVHEVTIALAQARSSVDLALQIRSRLVDGYRELMNMQL